MDINIKKHDGIFTLTVDNESEEFKVLSLIYGKENGRDTKYPPYRLFVYEKGILLTLDKETFERLYEQLWKECLCNIVCKDDVDFHKDMFFADAEQFYSLGDALYLLPY